MPFSSRQLAILPIRRRGEASRREHQPPSRALIMDASPVPLSITGQPIYVAPIPSSVSLRSPASPSARKQPPGEASVKQDGLPFSSRQLAILPIRRRGEASRREHQPPSRALFMDASPVPLSITGQPNYVAPIPSSVSLRSPASPCGSLQKSPTPNA